MYIEIDFNSDEAIYMQLRNQIVQGIEHIMYYGRKDLSGWTGETER